MKTRNAILALLLAATLPVAADTANSSVLDIKHSITDPAIVYPESFETDTQRMMEGWYMKNYTSTDDRYRTMSDAQTSDALITKRLAALPTLIDMPFNQIVRSYIDRYTSKSRQQIAVLLGLSNYYMPIFEQALEARGLPLELKYLPVIESSLDPNAVSRHGATGLWQFMLGTAKGLGMEVNSLVDERRDPYLSSERAAAYLADLYATYGDWTLAIAAYNCGPGTLNKAIRRAGGDPKEQTFWSVYPYLPQETRGYVPMFIAANYVMNYYPEHNISPVLATKPLVTDTVAVRNRLHFDQIAAVLDIPVDELRLLNPQYRADIIPASTDRPYFLILPSQQIHAYLLSEDAIRDYEAERYGRLEAIEPATAVANTDMAYEPTPDEGEKEVAMVKAAAAAPDPSGQTKTIVHKVDAGETLTSIAEKYGVEPAQIKDWNSLRRNAVRTGQQLRIVTTDLTASSNIEIEQPVVAQEKPAKTPAKAADSSKNKKKQSAPKTAKHTVKSGDNLTHLAKKYGVTVDQIKKANGMTNDNLRAGETITIPAKGGSASKSSKKSSKKKRRR